MLCPVIDKPCNFFCGGGHFESIVEPMSANPDDVSIGFQNRYRMLSVQRNFLLDEKIAHFLFVVHAERDKPISVVP